jgi:hypothetical protein
MTVKSLIVQASGNIVLEHSTQNPKVKVSNPTTTGMGKEKKGFAPFCKKSK